MTSEENRTAAEELLHLQKIVARLRAPDGCPWDQQQTAQSLISYLLEEAYEVVEAIEDKDQSALKEELGDLLLHIVMQASIAEEQGQFKLSDSIRAINEKLVRRHPHVFGQVTEDGSRHDDAYKNWGKVKKHEGRQSWLDGVPKNLPGLIRAQRIQEKASTVGFDWDDVVPALEKFHEEVGEWLAEWQAGDQERLREEYGDVLFSLVNVGRLMKLDSESSMRQAVDKFDARFRALESVFIQEHKDIEAATLEEMDAVWDRIKHKVAYRK